MSDNQTDQTGSGSGNAGGTQTQQTNATTQQAQQPEYLTKDEARSIFAGIVKSTLRSELGPAFKTFLDTEIAPLKTEFAAFKQAPPNTQQQGDDSAKKPRAESAKTEADPKFVELEKKLAALESENKRANERAAAERRRNIEMSGYGALRNALSGKVRPELIDGVEAMIRGRNQMVFDEDGNARLKMRVRASKDLPEEDQELPIEEGIQHWLKTKEAAAFIPAPTQQTPPKRPPNAQTNGQTRGDNGQFSSAQNDPIAAFEAEHGEGSFKRFLST